MVKVSGSARRVHVAMCLRFMHRASSIRRVYVFGWDELRKCHNSTGSKFLFYIVEYCLFIVAPQYSTITDKQTRIKLLCFII